MEKPKYHIFVCSGAKLNKEEEGVCKHRGGEAIFSKFRELVDKYKLSENVLINKSDCFRCKISKKGPNLVIYPEGIWYGGVAIEDVEDIVNSHLINGVKVKRLLI